MFVSLVKSGGEFEQIQAGVDKIKSEAAQNYKSRALKVHPDHGGDEESMKALNAARDEVAKLRVERTRPVFRPVMTVVHVRMDGFGGSYTSSSTATTSTGGWW
jgi:hypothetical protein